MWLELMRRTGFPNLVVQDLGFTSNMAPDVYWAFVRRNSEVAPAA